MRIVLFAIVAIVLCSSVGEHKFYMSLTDVNLHESGKTLEFTSRFFTDDVERAISSDEALLKIEESMDEGFLPLLNEFYASALNVTVDGIPAQIDFIGYEVENELIWCYAEVNTPTKPEQVEIEGAWLYRLFHEQVNIINVHIGEVRSAYLNADEKSHLFELQ